LLGVLQSLCINQSLVGLSKISGRGWSSGVSFCWNPERSFYLSGITFSSARQGELGVPVTWIRCA
jgi:hypothetical protein